MSALAFDIPRDEFFEQCVKHLLCPAYITEQDLYDAVKTILDGKHCTSNISKLSNNNKPYIIHYLSLQDYIDMGAFPLPRYRLSITSAPGVTFDSLQLPDFFEEKIFPFTRKEDSTLFSSKLDKKGRQQTKTDTMELLVKADFLKDVLAEVLARGYEQILLPSRRFDNYLPDWRQTFYDKITGEVFFCSCFEDTIKKYGLEIPDYQIPQTHPHVKRALANLQFKEGICHMCRNVSVRDLEAQGNGAYPSFYDAYIEKITLDLCGDLYNQEYRREAENIVREHFGLPKIGEHWQNETLLYKLVAEIFSQFKVEREASPEWLKPQRLDIYIPELNLAIEYQGKQHFEPVALFGGEEGLKRTQERDEIKADKCEENGIDLVYFDYEENISEELILRKLSRYIAH